MNSEIDQNTAYDYTALAPCIGYRSNHRRYNVDKIHERSFQSIYKKRKCPLPMSREALCILERLSDRGAGFEDIINGLPSVDPRDQMGEVVPELLSQRTAARLVQFYERHNIDVNETLARTLKVLRDSFQEFNLSSRVGDRIDIIIDELDVTFDSNQPSFGGGDFRTGKLGINLNL